MANLGLSGGVLVLTVLLAFLLVNFDQAQGLEHQVGDECGSDAACIQDALEADRQKKVKNGEISTRKTDVDGKSGQSRVGLANGVLGGGLLIFFI